MFKELSKTPKNPRHFVALCFLQLKLQPELREKNFFMKKVGEVKLEALFHCAYGYFWVNKNREILSENFLESKESAIKARKNN